MERKIILASKSPRRKQILSEMGYNFDIIPSVYDEVLPDREFEPVMIQELAFNKANEVASRIGDDYIVIGADTMVIYNKSVLGKPHSKEEAFNMLKMLSNNRHYVVTGIAVIDNKTNTIYKEYVITYVSFNELSDSMINNYIENFHPLDKAGAYGIQELPEGFVKDVDGEFDNVVGLPSKALRKILTSII